MDLLAFDLQLFASEEKTEPATPRRREEARRKGQVAKTAELGTATILMAGFGILYLFGPHMAQGAGAMLERYFTDVMLVPELNETTVHTMFVDLAQAWMGIVMPIMVAAFLVGLLSQVVQVGLMLTLEPASPKFERVNPLAGFKRIFSKRALVELFKSLFKILIVGGIAFFVLRSGLPAFPTLIEMSPAESVILVGGLVIRAGLFIGLALLLIAIMDYAYQKFEFEQSIKMSKQEVRDEHKQMEGDPQVRQKVRQKQRQMASQRMMQAVPGADVVITNPVHLAVALKYDTAAMEAPAIVAKGAGLLAQRIRDLARENEITVVEDVWLARALYEGAEVGDTVPQHLYQAVAEVLAFVYRLKRQA